MFLRERNEKLQIFFRDGFYSDVEPGRWHLACVCSGHSSWLFSCSLSISCWTSACFTHILLTGLTFLCIYVFASGPSCWLFSSKGRWGQSPLLVSPVTNEPTWHKSPLLLAILPPPAEKAMASHSSTLPWKILWMEEPGRLQSMGSLRVGYDSATSLFTFMHWRGKWQPIPVFLPGESQGRGSLVGCRLWGHTESDTTEVT